MVRKPDKNGKDLLFCSNRSCKNISSYTEEELEEMRKSDEYTFI